MELEHYMLQVLRKDPGESLRHLPKSRIDRAAELMALKYPKYALEPGNLAECCLECTTFIDRANMIRKNRDLVRTLPFGSSAKTENFFSKVEAIRNIVAHGDNLSQRFHDPAAFNTFLATLRELTASLYITANSKGSIRPGPLPGFTSQEWTSLLNQLGPQRDAGEEL